MPKLESGFSSPGPVQRPGNHKPLSEASSPFLARVFSIIRVAAGPLLGLVLFAAVIGSLVVVSYTFLPVSSAHSAVADVIRIPPGASTRQIGELLAQRGVLRSPHHFVLASRLLRLDGRLQAGDYELSPAMSIVAVLDRLSSGDIATVRVTIPEGSNARDVARILQQRGLADADRFLELVTQGRDLVADLVPFEIPIPSLEGYLFPDTYRFPLTIDEKEIIRRMVSRFVREAYPLIEAGRGRHQLSVHEITTLASIVEKEAMVDAERPKIAGVFFNRLARGQPLQSDPTVQYVMANPRPRLYHRDLAIDSPYNTYRYRGLPPGPIASPGLASVRAVLEPAETEYFYFVARGDGTHVFSRTFAEHVAARRRLGR